MRLPHLTHLLPAGIMTSDESRLSRPLERGTAIRLKNPALVYTAQDKADAQLAKIFLGKHGIQAQVKGEQSEPVRSLFGAIVGAFFQRTSARSPLPGGPFGLDVEVYVEQEDCERAAAIVEEFVDRNRPATDNEASYDPAKFIRVTCDDCHSPAFFHVSRKNHVEQCPRCGEYLDVQ